MGGINGYGWDSQNPSFIGLNQKASKSLEKPGEETKEDLTAPQAQNAKSVEPDAVYKFLAAGSVLPSLKKSSINTSNYVDDDSKARISASIANFTTKTDNFIGQANSDPLFASLTPQKQYEVAANYVAKSS